MTLFLGVLVWIHSVETLPLKILVAPASGQELGAAAGKPVDLYLLSGQSNMQGIGKIADLPAEVPRQIPHTYFWNGQSFEPLILGQTKISARLGEFGPGVGFALETATADRPIYLIKYHASGMPLHHGWDGNQWVGGEPAPGRQTFYPGDHPGDPNTGKLYAEMRGQFQNGVKHLSEQGLQPTIRGFLWMQGEADAKHKDSATSYAASLNRLRQRLAEDLQIDADLPLVFGQVLPHQPALARFTHRTEIREQMAACDRDSQRPEAMQNTIMVSTDGFQLLPDSVHYDAAGQLQLGRAFAVAMKKLQPARLRVMTFNILQGGGEASNVGFNNSSFDGSRIDELADVIKLAQADVVGVQEDCNSDTLLHALGGAWKREGSVYSRFELTQVSVAPYLSVIIVKVPGDRTFKLVNCHWFPPPGGYGPELAQAELKADPQLQDLEAIVGRILEKSAVPEGQRGYDATLEPLRAAIENGESVILTGDFNEPSHLDWTQRYAQEGPDRWVQNSTGTPLRFAIPWPGSTKLSELGMIDSYRAVHPNEVKQLGATWTPQYPENTPGRRAYADQVRERIDRVYHTGRNLRATAAEVVGEDPSVADLVFPGRWPSDHRGVVVTFELK